jgi:hypothetical protein
MLEEDNSACGQLGFEHSRFDLGFREEVFDTEVSGPLL